jgi:chromosome partitioning protein
MTDHVPSSKAEIGTAEAVSTDVSRETEPVAAAEVTDTAVVDEGPLPHPVATRVFTVANQKGGVGKTTSTVNMAAALATAGLHVLVIDLDPQGNASTALAVDHREGVKDVYSAIVEGVPFAEIVQPVSHTPNLWCAPATIDLAGAELELAPLVAREFRLKRALNEFLEHHKSVHGRPIDYVFIDCPPSLGLLTINAFVAAREVLVPIQCEYYALEGLNQLLKTVDLIKDNVNADLRLSTILLTMYDSRTRLSQDVAELVYSQYGDIALKTAIPRSVRISEAPSNQQTVLAYDPTSTGAVAYIQAGRELARRLPAVEA